MIMNSDCLEAVKLMPSSSIDLVCTDPPYSYSFMGKSWDKEGAVDFKAVWKECLRVLKPGAFAFVMCAPRQDVLCKQIQALTDAGCEELEEKTNESLGANQHKCRKCGEYRIRASGVVCQCKEPEYYLPLQKNNHPCVKPLKLMSYLITMGSRPNDVVLYPFAGSGTTLVAAKALGRRFIGCEMNAEYVEIINARLNAATK